MRAELGRSRLRASAAPAAGVAAAAASSCCCGAGGECPAERRNRGDRPALGDAAVGDACAAACAACEADCGRCRPCECGAEGGRGEMMRCCGCGCGWGWSACCARRAACGELRGEPSGDSTGGCICCGCACCGGSGGRCCVCACAASAAVAVAVAVARSEARGEERERGRRPPLAEGGRGASRPPAGAVAMSVMARAHREREGGGRERGGGGCLTPGDPRGHLKPAAKRNDSSVKATKRASHTHPKKSANLPRRGRARHTPRNQRRPIPWVA